MSDRPFYEDPAFRENWERHSSEWGHVFRLLAEGRSPSRAWLARLLVDPGIPAWATPEEREAVKRTVGRPGKRTTEPKDPDDPWHWERFGRWSADQAGALMDLLHLKYELAEYETDDDGPCSDRWTRTIQTECLLPLDSESLEAEAVEIVLRRIRSRQVWRVHEPKVQALKIVAKRYGIAPDTLEGWERQFRESSDWLGQVF